uniref:GST N-terminal domain-containing protein n=1 Tax=Rhinopithecus bieti TaxID=61621 RepID=A0A2K6KK88_RHIBE
MPMTLGYGDIRGLAHVIRLLLEYTDSSYEEKKYTMGDSPNYDRSQYTTCEGRQKRRRFVWTFRRTRPWTTWCSWP